MHAHRRNRQLAALMVAGVLATGAAADGQVNAVFRIDSAFFRTAYPPAMLAQAEADVAAELARAARSHFGFLDWQSAGAATAGPRLILTMSDLPGGACDTPPTIRLRWSAVLESTERDLVNMPGHDLYRTCDPDTPTQEPARLVRDVVAAAGAMLGNEANRKRINDQVLARVPIATSLINFQNAMLLLPVSPTRLSADPDSTMIARFKFAGQSAAPLPSDIELRPRSEFDQKVQLLIIAINVPSFSSNLPARGAVWHDDLARILAGSTDLQVFMMDYIPSPFAGETVGDSGVLAEL